MNSSEVNPVVKYAFLAIPVTMLLIAPNLTDPINLPKAIANIVISITSLVLFISLRKVSPKLEFDQRRKLVLTLYLALGTAMAVSGFAGSDNMIRILFGTSGRNNGLLYYLSALLLALLILNIVVTVKEFDFLNKIFAWTSILFSIYCALQYLRLDPISWSNPYNRVIGFLGNPNFAASALAVFATFWGFHFVQAILLGDSRGNRILRFTLFFLMSSLAISTESLQAIVVLGLGLSLIIYTFIRLRLASSWIPATFLILLFFGFSTSFISFLGFGPLGGELEQYTLKLRSWYALFGVKAMLDNPLFGVGVDNYLSAFRLYRTQEFVERFGNELSSNNAHSIPIQLGATFGVFVFVLYCFLQVWILIRAVKILNSRNEEHLTIKCFAILWILVFSQSLLSIEIIGLGVINWVLGAVILGYEFITPNTQRIQSSSSKVQSRVSNLYPEWVGSLAIISIMVSLAPFVYVFREDGAYKKVIQVVVDSEQSRAWLKENYSKLSPFSLSDPAKLNNIIPKLYEAGFVTDAKDAIHSYYQVERNELYANDLLATFYQNGKKLDSEIAIRERMRDLSPLDYRLEGILARAYYEKKDLVKLKDSVSRIRDLAPESQEYVSTVKYLNELLAER